MIDSNKFRINTVSLEGPDLSGKSTLYNSLHKESKFKWDIRDRSFLSRVCFARQFNRDVEYERGRLEKELSNLNNRVIVLIPPFSVLESRYLKRGDEIQTLEGLRSLYTIYEEEVEKIQNLPGVLILRDVEDNIRKSLDFLSSSESNQIKDVGSFARRLVENHEKDELALTATIFEDNIEPQGSEILLDPHEGLYYKEILWDFENVIRKELRGLNPYGEPQDIDSRRFYYNSDSCISSIHLMPRGETLLCEAVFRSTNVVKNAVIDIEFLDYLVSFLGKKYFFNCKRYRINLKINSAHILGDQVRP